MELKLNVGLGFCKGGFRILSLPSRILQGVSQNTATNSASIRQPSLKFAKLDPGLTIDRKTLHPAFSHLERTYSPHPTWPNRHQVPPLASSRHTLLSKTEVTQTPLKTRLPRTTPPTSLHTTRNTTKMKTTTIFSSRRTTNYQTRTSGPQTLQTSPRRSTAHAK